MKRKKQRIFLVPGPTQGLVAKMFKDVGCQLVDRLKGADLCCFIGGEDVTPHLYGQKPHTKTLHFNPARDGRELIIFKRAQSTGIPMAGICRGAQFLNVMCDGELWQDADNHRTSHDAYDKASGIAWLASSTHHQMMIPGPLGEVLAFAIEADRKIKMDPDGIEEVWQRGIKTSVGEEFEEDPEVILYPGEKVLCFQPHPEHSAYTETTKWFFTYLEQLY